MDMINKSLIDIRELKELRSKAEVFDKIQNSIKAGHPASAAVEIAMKSYNNRELDISEERCFICKHFIVDTDETDSFCRLNSCKVGYKDICPAFTWDGGKNGIY